MNMTTEQAISILAQFRLQASGPNLTGREFDMTALALQVLTNALKPADKPAEPKVE